MIQWYIDLDVILMVTLTIIKINKNIKLWVFKFNVLTS